MFAIVSIGRISAGEIVDLTSDFESALWFCNHLNKLAGERRYVLRWVD